MTSPFLPAPHIPPPVSSPDDAATIVMRPIRDDSEPDDARSPDTTIPPGPHTPRATDPMSHVSRWIADVCEAGGEPLSVDFSALLREATVSLSSREDFTRWSGLLAAADADHVTTRDHLGTLVTVTVGGPADGSWRVRLVWHGRSRS